MNAKHTTITLLAATLALASTTALAQDRFGSDTLSGSLASGYQPLGAVMVDELGEVGVVHVGNIVTLSSRSGTTTAIELLQGDLYEGLLYDFDWAVQPQDVSVGMAEKVASSTSQELVGIIVRNTEGEVDLEPLGIMETEASGYVNIGPITVVEISGGVELAAPSIGQVSQCCITTPEVLTTARLDRQGYVDLYDAGTVSVEHTGSLLEGTTYGR